MFKGKGKNAKQRNDYKLNVVHLSQLNSQDDVQICFLMFTHLAKVEDLGNGLGDEQDFRPVTTDN